MQPCLKSNQVQLPAKSQPALKIITLLVVQGPTFRETWKVLCKSLMCALHCFEFNHF